MSVSLSIIVPTLGRPSLGATLESISDQLHPELDEVIVVADGPQPETAEFLDLLDLLPLDVRYAETPATRCFGNAQRDLGMKLARGTHLLFIDDDDVYEPHGLLHARMAAREEPDAGHVFRMRIGPGHPAHGVVLWKLPEIREQNIGTPMVCLPNRPYASSWSEHDCRSITSDFGFLSDALGDLPVVRFHEDVIAVVRP